MAHKRLKKVDPNNVVIAAALAPTVGQDGGGYPGGGLDDLIFLQRIYAAGAGQCFDVAAAQGYGLFSGPYDQRTNPLQTNVARHVLMRDVMVRNGDATKPIWLSEVNWNAVPNDPAIADLHRFGMVTLEQQARYVPEVFERARERLAVGGGDERVVLQAAGRRGEESIMVLLPYAQAGLHTHAAVGGDEAIRAAQVGAKHLPVGLEVFEISAANASPPTVRLPSTGADTAPSRYPAASCPAGN